MTPKIHTIINIADRNESKFMFASGFVGTPSPSDPNTFDFHFYVLEKQFKAWRVYSLNHPCHVLAYIPVSRYVVNCIHEHRYKGGKI